MKTYLITGACGSGKTWAIKQIINNFNLIEPKKLGLYSWVENQTGSIAALGKYDGSTFEGSDKLSMSIMSDNLNALKAFAEKTIIAEGDRFINKTFILAFNPIIIRILGDGKEGRAKRGSQQTERHIKAIMTRANNIAYAYRANSSGEALSMICADLCEPLMTPKNYISQSLFTEI